MTIWVDADACPVAIRDILCKAANRTETPTAFVANQAIPLPPSKWIKAIRVACLFSTRVTERPLPIISISGSEVRK